MRNGSGTYSLPNPNVVSNTLISSAVYNEDTNDIAVALTGSVATDGQTPNVGPLKGRAGSPGAPTYTFQNDTISGWYLIGTGQLGLALGGVQIATFTSSGITYNGTPVGGNIPSGVVNAFAGSAAPSGWLLCDGSSVSRTGATAALFAVIGITYGAGAIPSEFNLPDLRGRIVAGLDNMGGTPAGRLTGTTIAGGATSSGNTGGEETHTLVTGEMPTHTHTDTGHTHALPQSNLANYGAGGSFAKQVVGTEDTATGNAVLSNTGGGAAHDNVQPTMVMNMIIKL